MGGSIHVVTGVPFFNVTFNDGTDVLVISGGNYTNMFNAGAILTATGTSTTNDGYYEVVSSVFTGGNTEVTVISYNVDTAYPGTVPFVSSGTGTVIWFYRGGVGPTPPLYTWIQEFGFPIRSSSDQTITDIDYGGGTYVGVGSNLTIISSTDGINWTLQDPGVSGFNPQTLRSIKYLDGQWVAVGDVHSIGDSQILVLTSPDGVTWTRRTTGLGGTITGTNVVINDISYGNGVYVLVGGDFSPIVSSRVYYSSDSISWTRNTSNPGSGFVINAIDFGNGIFTHVGGNSGNGIIATSTNGSFFTTYGTTFGSFFDDVAFKSTGNVWVAVSPNGDTGEVGIITSSNNWTSHSQNLIDDIDYVVASGSLFVAGGSNNANDIYTSTDGTSWSGPTSLPLGFSASSAKFINDEFTYIGPSNYIVSSEDGTTDFLVLLEQRNLGRIVSDGAGVSVIGVSSTNTYNLELGVTTAPNSTTWNFNSSNIKEVFPDVGYEMSMAYGNGTFVMGLDSISVGTTTRLASSTDGITWTEQDGSNTLDAVIRAMVFGDGIFVGVGSINSDNTGAIITSSDDGVSWTSQTIPDNDPDVYLQSVAYGNNIYVAGGWDPNAVDGFIATSTDATTWTHTTILDRIPGPMAYGNGKFISVMYIPSSNGNQLVTSSDGITWVDGLALSSDLFIQSVVFADGAFVFVGQNSNTGESFAFTTIDGSTITEQVIPANYDGLDNTSLTAVTYDGSRFVAVGSDSIIYVGI